MNKYKNIITLFFLLWTSITVYGQKKVELENNKAYMVWTYMYAILDSGNINDIWIDTALIESLPKSMKKIIAHYSTLIPAQMIDSVTDVRLAKCFGHFSSMQEVRENLLKDWNCSKTSYTGSTNNKVNVLYISMNKKSISFMQYVYGYEIKKYTDEFKIGKNNNIIHIQNSEDNNIDKRIVTNREVSLKLM
jgi:hypothetical protein